MSDFIKKNWFVSLIALLLCGTSIFYIYDTNKGKLKGKTANGEDVVYEINGEDIGASAFYDELYKEDGVAIVYQLFEKAVASSVEATDEMKESASQQAVSVLRNYQQNYPTDYEQILTDALISVGYDDIDDLEEYLLQYEKISKITSDYARAHTDELQVRNISYILIMFEGNPSPEGSPTPNEQAKMAAVDEAFANGTDFADVAIEFSEDSSTAPSGGVLGTVDNKTTTLDTAFLNAALSLQEGEISDWVYSENFGYFRIKNNASTLESLEALAESGTDPYEDLTTSYDTVLINRAIWEKGQELGITFADEELEGKMKEYLGISEE